MDVLVLIDKLDDLVHGASTFPMTDKVMIDRDEIYDLLDQMRATIPEEIKQARWIVKERQEMLQEAKEESERILARGPRRGRTAGQRAGGRQAGAAPVRRRSSATPRPASARSGWGPRTMPTRSWTPSRPTWTSSWLPCNAGARGSKAGTGPRCDPGLTATTQLMDPNDPHLDLRGLNLKGGQHAERSFEVDLPPIHLAGQTYQVVPKPDGVVVRVDRINGGFLVTVRVAAGIYGVCMRCLKEVVLDMETEQQEFAPSTQEPWGEGDVSAFIADLVVDVPALAREALVLALPDKILCSPTCRGLCPQCGQDLSAGTCSCEVRSLDPRLEKLREFRPNR